MTEGSSDSEGRRDSESLVALPSQESSEAKASSGEPEPPEKATKDAALVDSSGDITHLLVAWSQGDIEALNAIFPLAFEDLRRLARKHYGRLPVKSIQPTALIGELYEVLLKQRSVKWESRGQFYNFAAFLIERTLRNYKRALNTEKRGGQATTVPIVEALDLAVGSDASSLFVGPVAPLPEASSREAAIQVIGVAVDIAEKLADLAKLDPVQADVVRLRHLIGLTREETAEALGVSVKTVSRKWRNAKRFLARELDEYSDEPSDE